MLLSLLYKIGIIAPYWKFTSNEAENSGTYFANELSNYCIRAVIL
jgi:hypothetical protein